MLRLAANNIAEWVLVDKQIGASFVSESECCLCLLQ